MELHNKPCIISVGVGGWYSHGIDRLERSLIFNGYAGDMIFWRDEYPENCPSHKDNPYAFKIYAFREAFKRGYKIVGWADCSFWAIQNPIPLFDIVNDKGNFGFRSGYNCAQTCSDALLKESGITRDEAEKLPETATGLVLFNIENPDGKKVFDNWADLCDKGLFKNSRIHDIMDSRDERFLFGRQDQSAYNMALYKAGVSFNYEDYVAYYNGSQTGYNKKKCIFFIGGI